MLKHEYMHPFRGFWNCEAVCHIRVYEHAGHQIIVCSELPDNGGTSITNFAEHLATDIWRDEGRHDRSTFVWIERYSDRYFIGGRPSAPEDFTLVTFTWVSDGDDRQATHPEWSPLDKAAVERLIGEPWQPLAPDLERPAT